MHRRSWCPERCRNSWFRPSGLVVQRASYGCHFLLRLPKNYSLLRFPQRGALSCPDFPQPQTGITPVRDRDRSAVPQYFAANIQIFTHRDALSGESGDRRKQKGACHCRSGQAIPSQVCIHHRDSSPERCCIQRRNASQGNWYPEV